MRVARVILFGVGMWSAAASSWAQTVTSPKVETASRTVSLPLSFEQAGGNGSGSGGTFSTRSRRGTLMLRKDGLVLASPSPLRLDFAHHNPAVQVSGERVLPGKVYHATGGLTGSLAGNPTFRQVRYSRLYPGIDAIFYGNEREVEFDFQVAPHGDADQIRISVTGGSVTLEPTGDLLLRAEAEDIRLRKPVIYQVRGGVRHRIDGGYRVSRGGSELRFRVGRYDHSQPLIIDPTISFASYFGGTGDDTASQVKVNPAGEIYLLGTTGQPDTLPPHQSVPIPVAGFPAECFLTKLAPDAAAVLYTVVFDGGFCGAMDLGGNGLVHLALSYSLRTLNEATMTLGLLQGAYDLGPGDGSVAQLRTDAHGNVYFVTAYTPDTITPPSFIFELRKVDSAGQLVFRTPLIQELDLDNFGDQVSALDVDDQDRAYVVGSARSDGVIVSTADAFQPAKSPTSQDGFLLKVNTATPAGQNPIEYATYLGGSQDDFLNAVLFDAATGSVLVSGFTDSPDFPTTAGTFAPSYPAFAPNPQAVLAGLDLGKPANQQMVFGTYLGARSTSFTLHMLPGSLPVISGYTFDHPATPTDPALSLVNSFYPAVGDGFRNYLAIFSPDASSLLFSTYLTPALNAEYGTPKIATNGSQTLYILTDVNSNGLAVGSVFQPANSGGYDLLLRAVDVSDLIPASGADLSVSATATPDPATVGTALTYSVVVKNLGPQTSAGVSLSLTFASSVTFQGASGALVCAPAAGSSTNGIACDLGTLAAGGIAQLDVSVAPQSPGAANVVVGVSSTTSDANATNDTVTLTTPVDPQRAHTTTVLSSSRAPSIVGQAVTFTATVTGASPAGTVTFTDGGSPLGAPVPLSGGVAHLTTTALTVASHSIVASYGGDAQNLGSSSPAFIQTVGSPVTSSVTVSSSRNPSTAGQPVTFTATVSGTNPTGTVTFMDSSSPLGTAALTSGTASVTTTALIAGYHDISASYGGDVSNLSGTSPVLVQTVSPTYSIIDLGAIGGGSSVGLALNDHGQVAGESTTSASGLGSIEPHAFVISAPYTQMTDLGTLGGDLASHGQGINELGQVAGYSNLSSTTGGSGRKAFLISPPYATMFSLGTLGGRGGRAFAINDAGQVTGEAETADEVRHGFFWDGTMHDLSSIGGSLGSSSGFAINAAGQVTGSGLTGSIGSATGLGINASGQITGIYVAPNGQDHAFLWDGAMHDLGTLGGPFSDGRGINASGEIVGTSEGQRSGQRAFRYTKTDGMVDLNTLLPSGSGWFLEQANAINDAGQITGMGTQTTCGPSSCVSLNHAYLLTPPPPPMGAMITGAAVAKPPSGTADAVFTVTYFNTGNQPVAVHFVTAPGTAVGGTDYVATSGTLTFAPGVTTRNITAQVIGGAPNQTHVSFSVVLRSGTDGSVIGTGVGTILVPAHPPQIDYSVSASPSSLSLGASSDRSSDITLHSDNGVTETAHVTAAWSGTAPTGVTFGLFPADVNIVAQASPSALTTLTVQASASASAGTFHLAITAVSASGITKSADVPVVIIGTPPPPPPPNCCTSAGPFVDPAPGVNIDIKNDGASPSGKYEVVASGGAPAGLANITVTRASTQSGLVNAQATHWGFSPDNDRFVTSWVQGSSGGTSIHHVALYDLTRANPQAPIWTSGDATHSSRVQFSPSGRYLFYTDVVDGPLTQLRLIDAHTGTVLFSSAFPQVAGGPVEGQDSLGTIGWGFGPNDSRFVFGYLSGPTNVQWNLVNLEKGPARAGVKTVSLLNETSDYWQFSSCGDVIGLVRQPGQQFVFVGLYRTSDGNPVGPEVQIASPVQTLKLRTTSTGHVATVNGVNYPLGPVTAECSAPPPPPPPAPACCTSAGPFVAPAAGVSIDVKRDGSSPSGKYQVIAPPGTGLANITVKRVSTQQTLVTAQAARWGFSPDNDRFVTSWVQDSGGAAIHHVALYDLTGANSQAAIWTSDDATQSARIQFSPSGRYLFYTDVVGGPITQVRLIDAHTGTVVFSSAFPQVSSGPVEGKDSLGTIGWGFGPNDSRFVFGYLSGPTNVEWNLVNLEQGPAHAGVKTISLLNETSDYWQFSSCGEVIALVRQPGQQFVFVGLYHTNDGTPLGTEVQIPAPVQQLDLHTTPAGHMATVNGTSHYPLGAVTPACELSVTAHSPVDILLVDAEGRRAGFDSRSGTIVNEIPGGRYTGPGTEPQTITVPYVAGTYRIEAYGVATLTTAEPYRLTIATSGEVETDEHDIAGMASARTLQQFVFTVDDGRRITSLSPVDATPPLVTPTILGIAGGNGWYTSDVVISWNIVDGESPVQTSSGCAPVLLNSDSAGVTFSCTATSAGGTASNAVTLKRDTAPPVVSCGSPDGQWHATDISIACTASDSGSGLAGLASAGFAVRTAVPAGSETSNASTGVVRVCDVAGNCANAGPVLGNMVDKRAPGIAVATPANGAVYSANQKVAAAYSCSDQGSGMAGCAGTVANGAKIDTTPNGVSAAKSFTVSAVDKAGNAATQRVSYVISCHYVEVAVSPSAAKPKDTVTVTARVLSCTGSSQSVQVKFELTGPHGAHGCSSAKTLMFTTPSFTIPTGTAKTISFPFAVPKNACAGTYSIVSTTLINGAAVDTTTGTLTIR